MIKWNDFFYGTGVESIDNGRKELFHSLYRLNDQMTSNGGIDQIHVLLKKVKLMLNLQFYSEEARFQAESEDISAVVRTRRVEIMHKLKSIAHKILRCGNAALISHEFYSEFFLDFTAYARDTSRMICMDSHNRY